MLSANKTREQTENTRSGSVCRGRMPFTVGASPGLTSGFGECHTRPRNTLYTYKNLPHAPPSREGT